MPKTVIIKKRRVYKTESNMQILTYWEECEESILSEKERQYILDKTNIVKLKGNIAYILRWFEDHEIHIADAGQVIVLKELKMDLDYRAYLLYRSFNNFMNDVAGKMNLTAIIDADILDETKAIDNTFALIKTILLRILLTILSNKGSRNNESQKYLYVFSQFVQKISSIEIEGGKDIFDRIVSFCKDDYSDEFSSNFLRNKNIWKEKITFMVRDIELLNTIKNVVETNLERLSDLQEKAARYLFLRLKLALNKNVKQIDYFTTSWIADSLLKAEQDIINRLNNNSKEIVMSEVNPDIAVTMERKQAICNALQKLKDEKTIQISDQDLMYIKNLYEALYNITFIMSVVGGIDELTTIVGCVPFMMEYMDANELHRCIEEYTNQCESACTDAGLQKTIIHKVITANENVKNVYVLETFPFSKLADKTVLNSMSSAVSVIFRDIISRCVSHERPNIICNHERFQLTSPKDILLKDKQIPQIIEKQIVYLEASEQKATFLDCLNLKDEDMTGLFQYLKQENDSWQNIYMEAFFEFSDKELPYDFKFLLGKHHAELKKYDEFYGTRRALAYELRCVIMENNENFTLLPKSDKDLLDYAQTQAFSYLKGFADRITACNKGLCERERLFGMALKEKDFVLAYFQYKYLDRKEDLCFLPGFPTTIKAVAEYKRLGIVITNESAVDDNCNSSSDPEKIIHINVSGNRIKPEIKIVQVEPATIKNPVAASEKPVIKELISSPQQDKEQIHQFLFSVLETDQEQLKLPHSDIIAYFLTDDKTLTLEGWAGAKNTLMQAKDILRTARNEGNDFEGCILKRARTQIFSAKINWIEKKHPESIKEFVKINNGHLDKLIYNYMYNEMTNDYNILTKEMNPQIYYNNDSLLLLLKDGKFLAFYEHPYYYMKKDDNDHQVFKAIEVDGDGDCALHALNIDSRKEFIAILKEALKKPENQELFAFEIRNDLCGKSVDSIHDSEEWKSLFSEYQTLHQELDLFRRNFQKSGFVHEGSNTEYLDWLKTEEVSLRLLENEKNDVKQFEKKVKITLDHDTKLLNYCKHQSRVDAYLELLSRDHTWIGKYSLRIYASEKKFSLFIYDKLRGNDYQQLNLDKETSLNILHSSRTEHIVFTNANHYDKLIMVMDHHPKKMAEKYMKTLKQKLIDATSLCIMNKDQSLEDYKNCLATHQSPMTDAIPLSQDEMNNLGKCNDYLKRSQKWNEVENIRDKKLQDIKDNFSPVLGIMEKLKDHMILVDEPRDENNRTLLYRALEKKNRNELVDYLLKNNASVLTRNGNPDFYVTTLKPVKNHTYVLETNGNQWELTYYNTPNEKGRKISIEEIPGLELWLRKAGSKIEEDNKDARRLIKPCHELWHLKTPLLLVAEDIGFNQENPLYYTLLSRAQAEFVDPDKKLASLSPVMYDFFLKFVTSMREHLDNYCKTIRERKYKRLNPVRAVELAHIYQAIIDGVKTHNYEEMLGRLCEIQKHAVSTWNSDLYEELSIIINDAIEWKNKHVTLFTAVCHHQMAKKIEKKPEKKPEKPSDPITTVEQNTIHESSDEKLQQQVSKLKHEIEQLQEAKNVLVDKNKRLETEKENLAKEIQEYKQTIANLKKKGDTKETKIKDDLYEIPLDDLKPTVSDSGIFSIKSRSNRVNNDKSNQVPKTYIGHG